jgi:hypothetical protein
MYYFLFQHLILAFGVQPTTAMWGSNVQLLRMAYLAKSVRRTSSKLHGIDFFVQSVTLSHSNLNRRPVLDSLIVHWTAVDNNFKLHLINKCKVLLHV